MTDVTLTPLTKPEKRILYLLAGIAFANILDFMVLMPLGPMLKRDFGIGADQFGVLVSVYAFAAAGVGLLGALFLDQFERKKSLLVITSCFVLATLACALAPTFEALLVARALAGAFGGLLTTITSTMVGDYIPPERRGRAGAIMSSSFALCTVAGVPLSLFLASHVGDFKLAWLTADEGWRIPFMFVTVLAAAFCWLAKSNLPAVKTDASQALSDKGSGQASLVSQIANRLWQTVSEINHLWAFAFGASVLFSSFCVIPYLTIYATGTIYFPEKLLSLMYLIGGTATLFSARWIGRRTDRIGKRKSYYQFALLALIPLLAATHAHLLFTVVPPWVYIGISTLFFVLVSGRWIPALALMTGAAKPELRGTFMAINGSAQQAAMGVATLVSGQTVSSDANGVLHGFHYVGYLSVAATLVAFWLVRRVKQVA